MAIPWKGRAVYVVVARMKRASGDAEPLTTRSRPMARAHASAYAERLARANPEIVLDTKVERVSPTGERKEEP